MTKFRFRRSKSSGGKRASALKSAGSWQLKDAKARLSEVLQRAEHGPQTVTVHGKPKAVVVSAAQYARLKRPKMGKALAELFEGSPLGDLPIASLSYRLPVRDVGV